MSCWATLTNGDFEQSESLIHNMYRSIPVLKEGIMNRFGVDGIYMPESMNPYGTPVDHYMVSHLEGHFNGTVEVA